LNQREAAKFLSPHPGVDDHHIRTASIIESIADQEVTCLDHSFAIAEIFDTNKYANNPKSDFLN
jgi:hypothetical protein